MCFVEMNSVVDAMFLHNQLLGEPPTIDDKIVSVSYFRPALSNSHNHHGYSNSNNAKEPTKAAANAALAAAQWSHQGRQGIANQYSHEDIERMAEYSASLYAKTPSEKAHYLEYYRNYYKNNQKDVNAAPNSSAAALPGASGGSSQEIQSDMSSKDQQGPKDQDKHVMVNGTEYPRYPTPDVSTYTYDEGSGYYYDPSTRLYYDSNSQYYWDSNTNKYVYWSPEHHTFLPAPADGAEKNNEEKPGKKEPKDKVKTAKKIAKDMEKWAKTLNQKKQQQFPSSVLQPGPVQESKPQVHAVSISPSVSGSSAGGASFGNGSSSLTSSSSSHVKSSEDVAFSIMNSKSSSNSELPSMDGAASSLAKLTGYGSDSAEESDSLATLDEQQLTDWSKLACLLCQRAFPSKEKLQK